MQTFKDITITVIPYPKSLGTGPLGAPQYSTHFTPPRYLVSKLEMKPRPSSSPQVGLPSTGVAAASSNLRKASLRSSRNMSDISKNADVEAESTVISSEPEDVSCPAGSSSRSVVPIVVTSPSHVLGNSVAKLRSSYVSTGRGTKLRNGAPSNGS